MKARKYSSICDAIKDVTLELRDNGIKQKAGIWQATELFKDEEMLVLRNFFWEAPVPSTKEALDILTSADFDWAEEHFQERVSGNPSNPGESYKRWPYNTFKEDDDPYKDGKEFSHTYMERFWPKYANLHPRDIDHGHLNDGIRYRLGDLNDVINQLKENKLTRQAYLPIFFPEDTGAVHKQRVPCTLGYYFYIEKGSLNCTYSIRSCDIYRHFRNDIYLTGRLLQYISGKLGLKVGNIQFLCYNLHIFVNNIYTFRKQKQNNIWNG